MQFENAWSKWFFLFQWTFMNLLGAITGIVFIVFMYAILLSDVSESVTAIFDQGISIAILGLFLGLSQWLALRSKMKQIQSWIPATAIGLVVGAGGFTVIRNFLIPEDSILRSPTMIAAVVGALLGMAQWTVLRKRIRQSRSWILGSTVGWSVGATVLMAVEIDSFMVFNVFQEILLGTLIMIIVIGIYSTITGCILIWFSNISVEPESSTI